LEQLFTKDQLNQITKVAETDLSYVGGYTLDGDATEISILTVSIKNNLIFTEGNEDTGFTHLGNRHNYLSYINYWTHSETGLSKLDKPSKFHPKMMPIIDFVKIADHIYRPENKNITRNSKPDSFDKYTGEYVYENEHKETYHLILYKDTKVVHTMFPQSKKKNQKVRTKYGKGIVTVSTKIPEFTHELLVPYEDNRHKVVYSILIKKYLAELKERSYIQKHNEEGKVIGSVLLGERSIEFTERFSKEFINAVQTSDLLHYENVINKLDRGEIKS